MKLCVDLFLFPEEGLEVLDPLEIGNDHTAGVGDHVRDDKDAALVEDRIGIRRDRGVGAFGDQSSANPSSIALVDLILHPGGNKHRDRQLEELRVADVLRLPESAHAASDLAM